ncbi:MAG: hypothetical protein Q7V62_10295 [Actinomycetota bacterium]|nr:hypothetical protein [Actinomycetota bacterium]
MRYAVFGSSGALVFRSWDGFRVSSSRVPRGTNFCASYGLGVAGAAARTSPWPTCWFGVTGRAPGSWISCGVRGA